MSKVTLDEAAIAKLTRLLSVVEVADEEGTVVGRFVPVLEEGQVPLISEEELDRREREEGGKGRRLKDFLADLEKMT
jgi:hypothetical protein